MSIQTQKEAVFTAVSSVLSEAGISFNEGEQVDTHLNRDLRGQITNILVEGFKAGTITLEKAFHTDSELRQYCSGLTSNWVRKDTRLNGGIKYVAKNPGSRVGSADAQLKAMRTLLSTKIDLEERAEIQTFISKRVAEVSASHKPAKIVDFSALPAELQAKYAQ